MLKCIPYSEARTVVVPLKQIEREKWFRRRGNTYTVNNINVLVTV